MIDQMGKTTGGEVLRVSPSLMSRICKGNAAQVLLIWQMVIVDGGGRICSSGGIGCCKSAFSRADHRYGWRARNGTRYAGGSARFNCAITPFQPEEGVHWLRIDILHYLVGAKTR